MKDVQSQNCYNYNETNLSDDPCLRRKLVKRGTKYLMLICNHLKATAFIMMCGNVSLYVVYKLEKLWNTWSSGGTQGARHNCSKSNWFDESLFGY